MAFLGVLAEHSESTDTFTVERLHANLWCLASWYGRKRRRFVFDVGVKIRADKAAVNKVELAIPFDTERPVSLWDKMRNDQTAALIFDAEITRREGNTIFYEDKKLTLAEVAVARAELDTHYTETGFSLWKIELTRPIPLGESQYFRLRFPVTGTGHTWQPTRLHGQVSGATFDFRISDVRSSQSISNGSDLISRIVTIESVAAFLVAPSRLYSRKIHPDPRYIRLLEGDVWSEYLDRAPEKRIGAQLVVYYWRNAVRSKVATPADPAEPVSTDAEADDNTANTATAAPPLEQNSEDSVTPEHPMRVYADMVWDSRPSRVWTVVWTAAATFALIALLLDLSARPWVQALLGAVGSWANHVWFWFLGILSVSVISALARAFKPGLAFWTWIRVRARRAEDRHFAKARHTK